MKHYQMIVGACACKSFSQDTVPFWGRGSINTDWGLPVDQTVPRGIDAMAGSIKNEERFKDR